MALNIEAMRQKLANSQNRTSGKSNDTKWRPSEGDQTIRILPTKDGDPFKEFHFHYNVGKNPGILCPKKNYGEHCPICDFAHGVDGAASTSWVRPTGATCRPTFCTDCARPTDWSG